MRYRKCLLILAVALLAPVSVPAATSVQEAIPAGAGDLVEVQVISGSLTIRGGSGDSVQVRGTIGDDVRELIVEREGDRIEIRPDIPSDEKGWNRKRSHDVEADLEIELPRGVALEVHAVSAPVSVTGLDAPAKIQVVSGRVNVAGAVDELEVNAVSGRIEVDNGATLRRGDFQTVSGKIDFRSPIASDARLSFNTVSGSIVLHVGSGSSASFDITTFSGNIANDFGHEAERTSEFAPGRKLKFSIGGGGGRVSINAFSGSVNVLEN